MSDQISITTSKLVDQVQSAFLDQSNESQISEDVHLANTMAANQASHLPRRNRTSGNGY